MFNRWVDMGERNTGSVEVDGSIPSSSTTILLARFGATLVACASFRTSCSIPSSDLSF